MVALIIVCALLAVALAFFAFKNHGLKNRLKKINKAYIEQNDQYNDCCRMKENLIEGIKEKNTELSNSAKELSDCESALKIKDRAIEDIGNRYNAKIINLESNNKKLSDQLLMAGNDKTKLLDNIKEKEKVNNELVIANGELKDQIKDLTKKNLSLLGSAGGYSSQYKELKEKHELLITEYSSNIQKYNELLETYNEVVEELESANNKAKVENEPSPVDDQDEEEVVPIVEKKKDKKKKRKR